MDQNEECYFILTLLNYLKLVKTKFKKINVVDAAEDRKKAQYFSLEYIHDDQERKETQEHYITNIEDYKKDLYVYPVSEGINPLRALNK